MVVASLSVVGTMARPVEVAGEEGWDRTWCGDVEEVV